MRKHGKQIALLLLALAALYFGWGYARSLKLESTLIRLEIPSNDDKRGTLRIAQVSDLHRSVYGEDNDELFRLVESKRPDLIVATGDMVDIHTESIDDCVLLMTRLSMLAPVCYSLGNHEIDRPDLDLLLLGLRRAGIYVLSDSAVTLEIKGLSLTVGGVYYERALPGLLEREPSLDILLCHFPQFVDAYAASGIPLTFSGHTHGGQFRVPLLDLPLYAPNQGVFPRYTTGLYDLGGNFLIVSRGLGNSSFPFRIHNPPEVVIADVTYTLTESL